MSSAYHTRMVVIVKNGASDINHDDFRREREAYGAVIRISAASHIRIHSENVLRLQIRMSQMHIVHELNGRQNLSRELSNEFSRERAVPIHLENVEQRWTISRKDETHVPSEHEAVEKRNTAGVQWRDPAASRTLRDGVQDLNLLFSGFRILRDAADDFQSDVHSSRDVDAVVDAREGSFTEKITNFVAPVDQKSVRSVELSV